MTIVKDCSFELSDHPPYSPDLVPLDLQLFPNLEKHLAGEHLTNNETFMAAAEAYLDIVFFHAGWVTLQQP